ncbi:MAG TPA: PAS domain S-box protein [Kineosporiaceae bacterium]|nr:PAS domain S-box protein [Kineosporiaceae bacterium]
MSGTAPVRPRAGGLADALDLATCAVDDHGVIVEVNRAWRELLSVPGLAVPRQPAPPGTSAGASAPPGTSAGASAGPEDPASGGVGLSLASWAGQARTGWQALLAGVAADLSQVLGGRQRRVSGQHAVHSQGRLREIDVEVRRLDHPTEAGGTALVSLQDVTERMWAHQLSPEQRRERERLELVGRYTDSAIAVLDLDGVIEWVSDTFVALTGFTRDEAVGRPRWELVRGPFVQTDAYTRFEAEVRAGRSASVEAPVHRPDGSLYWSAWSVQPMFDGGRVVKLLCIERDITKRRRAEEMARQTLIRAQRLGAELRQEKHLVSSVLATVPLGVWWKDSELTYLGCNQGFVELRGLSSAAEVIGRKEAELPVSDLFGPRLEELEPTVVAGAEPVIQRRVTVAEPGQPMQTYLLSVLPRVENRQVVGVLGVCTDISQMAELERQVSQTSRLESIGQLAAGIAHEINTPVQYASDNLRFLTESFGGLLGGLRTLAELSGGCSDATLREDACAVFDALDLDFLAEEVPSALAQSREGLERVAQIVRAMKEFSHPGGERTPTDVNQLVESTVQVSRNEWKYVARLDQDLDPGVGEIPCYAGDLKQALLNIIVNAAHAVDERRQLQGSHELGRIAVSTRRAGEEVVIEVRDDGIGMDEDVRRRIFDPFFTTKSVGKGTGQGLSLAHSAIVTKHHGRIEVRSRPMEGSVFSIVLPVPAVVPEPSADPRPEETR